MPAELEPVTVGQLVDPLQQLVDDAAVAAELAGHARARNTMAAYESDWRDYAAWCRDRGVDPAAATGEVVAAYLGHLVADGVVVPAGPATDPTRRRPPTIATLRRRCSALAVVYAREFGHGRDTNPARRAVVADVLAGFAREHGAPPSRARAMTPLELARIVSAAQGPGAARNRALLLIGFAGALRRSELAALDARHVRVVARGLEVTVASSKTDQERTGELIPIGRGRSPETDPVAAWKAWRALVPDLVPAFCSVDRAGRPTGRRLAPRAVNRLLEHASLVAGVSLDGLSAHSLRAGYVTTAAQTGAQERAIQRVSRHQSIPVLRSYIRPATAWDDAATDLGL